MVYVIILIACLLPFYPLVLYDASLDPKAQDRRFFVSSLVLIGLACLGAIGAGFYALGVIEAPRWVKLVDCGVMGAVWIACVIKNAHEYRRIFGDKPEAPSDELA